MKMVSKRLSSVMLAIALVSVVLGCDHGPLAPLLERRPNIQPLTSGVVFELYEAHGPKDAVHPEYNAVSNPRIAIRLETEREYGCYNYYLETSTSFSGNHIQIHLLGVSISDVCLTAIGPARSTFFLDLDEGVYELNFLTDKSLPRSFELTIRSSSIEIAPTDSGFVWPRNGQYWRSPPNSFAVICGTTVATSWMCDAFVDSLRANIQLEEFSFPDSGAISWPRESSGHYYDAPTRFFRYREEADFRQAGEVLKVFKEDAIAEQQGIGIWLWNWRNEKYMSWMFKERNQGEHLQ